MRKFILGFGAMFLTFTLGLAGNFIFNGLGSGVERWFETPEPVLEEPCATALAAEPEPNPLITHCGLLVIQIDNDRRLKLYGEEMGSLDDPSLLVRTLERVFTERTAARAYKAGFELNSDICEAERIEKTVLIRASRQISYGDVSDLIDGVRGTGAKPIGLVTKGSGYPQAAVEANR